MIPYAGAIFYVRPVGPKSPQDVVEILKLNPQCVRDFFACFRPVVAECPPYTSFSRSLIGGLLDGETPPRSRVLVSHASSRRGLSRAAFPPLSVASDMASFAARSASSFSSKSRHFAASSDSFVMSIPFFKAGAGVSPRGGMELPQEPARPRTAGQQSPSNYHSTTSTDVARMLQCKVMGSRLQPIRKVTTPVFSGKTPCFSGVYRLGRFEIRRCRVRPRRSSRQANW